VFGLENVFRELPRYDGSPLVVVQPTPFCNINCDYCYLPNRNSTDRLGADTFRKMLEALLREGFLKDDLSIVWHAGEPMVLPVSYYTELFRVIDDLAITRSMIHHSFQTNGTLISAEWCDFFKEYQINLGISLDGPAHIHDRHRRSRDNCGTHARILKGIQFLRQSDVNFHVISVVTSYSLDFADEIIDHFLDLGVTRLGFNIEETEGVHLSSSLRDKGLDTKIRRFWQRLHERQIEAEGRIEIREFQNAYKQVLEADANLNAEMAMQRMPQVSPLAIISMDCKGNVSSFSPELLGFKSVEYGPFAFGNIHEIGIRAITRNKRFKKLSKDISAGIRLCQLSCQYFPVCGGGAPANKFFENGTFNSTETAYCRFSIQAPFEVVLSHLESCVRRT